MIEKKETARNKQCLWINTIIIGPQGQMAVIKAICPGTSKSNLITNSAGCENWDENAGVCRIDAVIDWAYKQASIGQL
ncbi:MAG: hypothetical protein V1701_03025 [Planctomycetota bacterium]